MPSFSAEEKETEIDSVTHPGGQNQDLRLRLFIFTDVSLLFAKYVLDS